MENWEAFMTAMPAVPWEPNQSNVQYVERKWNNLFDPTIYYNEPLGPGAWQKVHAWENLSGEQAGWTWNLDLYIVYSPYQVIPDAMYLPAEAMGGIDGFYCTTYEEWLKGPNDEKVIIEDLYISLKNKIINLALRSCN